MFTGTAFRCVPAPLHHCCTGIIACHIFHCDVIGRLVLLLLINWMTPRLSVCVSVCLSVCLSVGHGRREQCASGWTDRDVVRGVDAWGPTEPLHHTTLGRGREHPRPATVLEVIVAHAQTGRWGGPYSQSYSLEGSSHVACLQCFDAVGWAAGRASVL